MAEIKQIGEFVLDGEIVDIFPYGNGHINSTYKVIDSTGKEYILQSINTAVFKEPELLMANVAAVISYLKKAGLSDRELLQLMPAREGKLWHVDEDGKYWRLYRFIPDSICLEHADSPELFEESARAFGNFQRQLADFPADSLAETIANFHDTPDRYRQFHMALEQDLAGRSKLVQPEIDFALSLEQDAGELIKLLNQGELPLRVTHNDTKLNNVLFDRETGKALCVIDLDTVMPGLSVNDFGDAIRFGASTAAEDEQDLSRVEMSLEYFEAYVRGYLSVCGDSLTDMEKKTLCLGAKTMTLECGLRFLTDYLNGDSYFKIHREGQNLDRCRTQFKLVADMQGKWKDMEQIVKKYS